MISIGRCGRRLRNFFNSQVIYCRTLGSSDKPEVENQEQKPLQKIICSEAEREVLGGVIANVLRYEECLCQTKDSLRLKIIPRPDTIFVSECKLARSIVLVYILRHPVAINAHALGFVGPQSHHLDITTEQWLVLCSYVYILQALCMWKPTRFYLWAPYSDSSFDQTSKRCWHYVQSSCRLNRSTQWVSQTPVTRAPAKIQQTVQQTQRSLAV